jgi:excinuclease ABC subunit C
MAVESERFAQLAAVPPRPGCYLFRDADGAVLYVGKSACLRARVRSYFGPRVEGRTRDLVAKVARIETIVTESETAARALEAELIRRLDPPFNLRHEQCPYLCLTLTEPLPRVAITSHPRDDGNRYFGPYRDPEAIGAILGILREVFGLGEITPPPSPLPEAERGSRSPARRASSPLPASGRGARGEGFSPRARWEYRAAVNGAIQFLEGHVEETRNVLQERMEEAAAHLAFEEAARLRDLLEAVSRGSL